MVNTTAADPVVPGIFTTLNSTVPSGLSPGTTYYAHVRDSCGPGSVSVWKTVSFHTTGSLAVNDMSASTDVYFFSIHPNPVTGIAKMIINGEVGEAAEIQVLDITGRLVKTIGALKGNEAVDMSGLAPGIYLCKYNDGHRTKTIRMVKQ